MDTKKKKHTRASLNLYLVAGLYLLYIDYSLISNWSDIETPGKKIMVAVAVVAFAAFALVLLRDSITGLSRFKQEQAKLLEEIKAEEAAQVTREDEE